VSGSQASEVGATPSLTSVTGPVTGVPLTCGPNDAVPMLYEPATGAGALTLSRPIGPSEFTQLFEFTPLHTSLPQLIDEAARCAFVSAFQPSPVTLSNRNWS